MLCCSCSGLDPDDCGKCNPTDPMTMPDLCDALGNLEDLIEQNTLHSRQLALNIIQSLRDRISVGLEG